MRRATFLRIDVMTPKRLKILRSIQQAQLNQPSPNRRRRIPANLSAQAPNNSYDPPTYYEDRQFHCLDCDKQEIWTAEQQQWWYEVAKGSIYSGAVRCRDCRQKRRAEKEEQRRRSEAGRNKKEKAKPGKKQV